MPQNFAKNVRNAPFLVFAELKIEPDRPLVCCIRLSGQSGQRLWEMVSETKTRSRKPILFLGIDPGRYLQATRPINTWVNNSVFWNCRTRKTFECCSRLTKAERPLSKQHNGLIDVARFVTAMMKVRKQPAVSPTRKQVVFQIMKVFGTFNGRRSFRSTIVDSQIRADLRRNLHKSNSLIESRAFWQTLIKSRF